MSLKNLAKLISATNKEKTPEQEFLFQLNEAIQRLDAQNSRTPSKTYKPSSLGGCMRNMYFQVVGAEQDAKTNDASFIGICESGTDRHDRIQNALAHMKSLGYDLEWIDVAEFVQQRGLDEKLGTHVVSKQGMETKLRNDVLNMSFLCDGIVKFNGQYYIIEIKTEVSFKWQSRTDIVEKHKYQASAYSVALGIDKIFFIYENRDFCSKKVFLFEVTEQDKEERVIHRIETCNSYIDRGEVPPMTDVQSECKYCSYVGECKKYGSN